MRGLYAQDLWRISRNERKHEHGTDISNQAHNQGHYISPWAGTELSPCARQCYGEQQSDEKQRSRADRHDCRKRLAKRRRNDACREAARHEHQYRQPFHCGACVGRGVSGCLSASPFPASYLFVTSVVVIVVPSVVYRYTSREGKSLAVLPASIPTF